jgi:DNA/RNA-binding domain of Phe-tRNA-synthetase-like protein
MIIVQERWKRLYPGATVGVLVVKNAGNPRRHPRLEEGKQRLEEELRARFPEGSLEEVKSSGQVQAYTAYYKRFKKTYPVLHQLSSVLSGQRSFPTICSLVDAMYMAEVKNMLLTAGHDLDKLEMPLCMDVSTGTETYTRIDGGDQVLKANDMMILDGRGVISCVVYGPDARTRITRDTRNALYVVYAPPGIDREDISGHLDDIREGVLLACPEAQPDPVRFYPSRECPGAD